MQRGAVWSGATPGAPGLSPTGETPGRGAAGPARARPVSWPAPAALYASVLPRALETAAIVSAGIGDGAAAGGGLRPVRTAPRGGRRARRGTSSASATASPTSTPIPTRVVAPGGESWSSFVARASGAVRRVAGAHRGERRRDRVPCRGDRVDAAGLLARGAGPGPAAAAHRAHLAHRVGDDARTAGAWCATTTPPTSAGPRARPERPRANRRSRRRGSRRWPCRCTG